MVITQSTHPLEVTLASDQDFNNILVSDTMNEVVELNYEENVFSCKSEPVTIYIKAEDEEHDSTQLTIQDPVFELCGAKLIDVSLVLVSSELKNKVDVQGDLRHDVDGGSHVHYKVWKYTFVVEKTNDMKANYQMSIKVSEGNEGQDSSTTPFSSMKLLSLYFPANYTNLPITNTNKLPEIKTFNITNPTNLYLQIPQEIEKTIQSITFKDILGINSDEYGTCQNCLNNYVIEVKYIKEIYPHFFSKDCDKFMFNYKRVEESEYIRLSDFDSNLITTDIGINTLIYRVVCKETGEAFSDKDGNEIIKAIVFQFNPVIHVKETNVTVPEGENYFDGSSNLISRKGDILEYYYDTNNETILQIKENEKYNQNLSVIVWEQGAKPNDTQENDYIKSLNPLTVKKYADKNNLINITVSPYKLALAGNDCYVLDKCGEDYTINYNEYKNNTYANNDNGKINVNCSDAPIYKLELTLNTDICVTHLWDSSICEYVPIEQGLTGTQLRNRYNDMIDAKNYLDERTKMVSDQTEVKDSANTQYEKYNNQFVKPLYSKYSELMDKYDTYKILYKQKEESLELKGIYNTLKGTANSDYNTANTNYNTANENYNTANSNYTETKDTMISYLNIELEQAINDLSGSDLSGSTITELTTHARKVEQVLISDLSFNTKTLELVNNLGEMIQNISAFKALLLDISGSNVKFNGYTISDISLDELQEELENAEDLLNDKIDTLLKVESDFTGLNLDASGVTIDGSFNITQGGLSLENIESNLQVTITPSYEFVLTSITISYENVEVVIDSSFSEEFINYLKNMEGEVTTLTDLDVMLNYDGADIQKDFNGNVIEQNLASRLLNIQYSATDQPWKISVNAAGDPVLSAAIAVEKREVISNISLDASNVNAIVDLSHNYSLTEFVSVINDSSGVISLTNNTLSIQNATGTLTQVFDTSFNSWINDVASSLENYSKKISQEMVLKDRLNIKNYYDDLLENFKTSSNASLELLNEFSEQLEGIKNDINSRLETVLNLAITTSTQDSMVDFNEKKKNFLNVLDEYFYKDELRLNNLTTLHEKTILYIDAKSILEAQRVKFELLEHLYDIYTGLNDTYYNDISGLFLNIDELKEEISTTYDSFKQSINSDLTYEPDPDTLYSSNNFTLVNINNLNLELFGNLEGVQDNIHNTESWIDQMENKASILNNEEVLLESYEEERQKADNEYSTSLQEHTLSFNNEKTLGVFNVDTSLLNNHSFNVYERYVLFRQISNSKDIKLHYNNIYDSNNTLVIDDLTSKEEPRVVDILYEPDTTNGQAIPFITTMDLLQSITKYPEGSVIRQRSTIELDTSEQTKPKLTINNSYPHEFLIKLEIKEQIESICELNGLPTIANGIYGNRTEQEMFRIELGYLNTNVSSTLKFNRANVLGATENDEITKIDIVRNPSDQTKNYIDPMTIQNLFYQGNKNAHINKRLIGVRYSDPVMGEYLHDDDFFQNSVYVDYVYMITGKVGKYDADGNQIRAADTKTTLLKFSNGDSHNPSIANVSTNNRILLKDYLLTMDKFPNQCIPNDLLGFTVDLHFESLAIDGHSGNTASNGKGIQQAFTFYHVNECYRLYQGVNLGGLGYTVSPTMLPVTIEFKVDQLQFTDHKEQLLTKALRHNPNYRNTGVGGDGVVDGIDPPSAFDINDPDYTQIDTLYVAPRVPEGDGYSGDSWIDTVVQHDNGMGKALYDNRDAQGNVDISILAQSFITNYGNEFVIHETTRGYRGTNTAQNMEGSYVNLDQHPTAVRALEKQEYVFNNKDCLQLTNDDNRVMEIDLERSAQDVLFRHELGDTTDPVRYEQVRNATLEMQHSIKYVDYQGFSHPRYPPVKADEVVEDVDNNKVIQINDVLDPPCDEEARYALHKTFKWNLELDIIKKPELHMDTIEVTLMNDENAKLCRPFWMRGEEFAQWLKHAYERKVEQDVLGVEVEPTNAELHENENGNTAPNGGENNANDALDNPNLQHKHMYIDNQGEFHHQFGEKVWIEEAEYIPNTEGSSDDKVKLSGIGNNTVGMVAKESVVSDVSLCPQEAPEFSGLEQCVDVLDSESLLDGLRDINNTLNLGELFANNQEPLEVKYWNAVEYWNSNNYVEGQVGGSNDFHDPNDVEGDQPGLTNDTNNDGPVDFNELTKNPREEVYTTDKSFLIDNDSVNFRIVYKANPTDIAYTTTKGNRDEINTLLVGLSNEQISVIEIPLIKQDEPEQGYVSKTTRVVLKVSVQDITDPDVSLVDNGDYEVNRLVGGTVPKWLSSQIVVSHPRYVFEFAHLVEQGYVWDKFEDNNCITIRDLLAPKVLAYKAEAPQLETSVLTRDNPNSVHMKSGLTGVVPSNCANCYQETHVTSLEYVSTRKDDENVDEPDNDDNDPEHDSIFNGDVFEGTLTISGYTGEKLTLSYEQVEGTYVSVVTNNTHTSAHIAGNGVGGEDYGELVMLQKGEKLWNRMELDRQNTVVVSRYLKQREHRFTSVNVFERDVDLSYPSCGTLKVTARVVLPSAMLEQCPVTTQTVTTLSYNSVFKGLLLDINRTCGLINEDVITELPFSLNNVEDYKHVTLDCSGGLNEQGVADPVVFAKAKGSLACSLSFNVVSSEGCLIERYAEYDENTATREECTDLGGKLSIDTYDIGKPTGEPTGEQEDFTDKVYNILTTNDDDVSKNLRLGGSPSVQLITLNVATIDASLYCEEYCDTIFKGMFNKNGIDCENETVHNIKLIETSVPELLFRNPSQQSKSNIEVLELLPNDGHFSDTTWEDHLETKWDVPELLKKDASGNANLRVLIREITVDGVNHYNGDIKGIHLIYNSRQLIDDVITRSNNLTKEEDLVDLVNNELEASKAKLLQINAYSQEEIKVTYQAIGFLGKYLVNSDIKTINFKIQ